MAFTVISVVCRDFWLSPCFCVTAVKTSILCVISAFERSLMYTESCAVADKPHDVVVKFDTYRNFSAACEVLPALARLSCAYYATENRV